MSIIKDKILYSTDEHDPSEPPKIIKNAGDFLFSYLKKVIKEEGDFELFTNATYDMTGKTNVCGKKSKMASEIETDARRFGVALYDAGVRRNDVVQFYLPNNTEYHTLAYGTMLLDATISLSDPGLSVPVMTQQIIDTKAKVVIGYEGSRKTIFQALKNLDLLDSVKVILLKKGFPKPGEDQPISDEEKSFISYEGNAS